MARVMHPNSLANLKKGKPIQEQENANHGRDKTIFTIGKEQDFSGTDVLNLYKKYYRTPTAELRKILMNPDATAIEQTIASAVLKDIEDGNLRAFTQFMDRELGKPRQSAEIEGNFNITPPPIIIEGDE